MTPEGKVADECLRYLNQNGWYAFSILTTGVYDTTSASFRKRGAFAVKGVSDCIAVKDGKTLFIEFKTPTGVQSDHQRKFETAIHRHGGTYLLVRSLGELHELLGKLTTT